MKQKVLNSLILSVALSLSPTFSSAFVIEFDYGFDTSGMFTADFVNTLDYAASFYESRITDDFSAITPISSNTWTASVFNPSGGAFINETDLNISADTVKIYIGAQDISGSTLGFGGPGGHNASGSVDFFDALRRGQINTSGPGATDFGNWGGAISFNTNTNWHSGIGIVGLDAGESDFLSVALHEIGHVLGIGTSESWDNSNPFALTSDGAHLASGTMSFVDGIVPQEAAFDPSLTTGTRKLLTDIDFLALEHVGYVIAPVPEMGTWAMMLMGFSVFGYSARRKKSKTECLENLSR